MEIENSSKMMGLSWGPNDSFRKLELTDIHQLDEYINANVALQTKFCQVKLAIIISLKNVLFIKTAFETEIIIDEKNVSITCFNSEENKYLAKYYEGTKDLIDNKNLRDQLLHIMYQVIF